MEPTDNLLSGDYGCPAAGTSDHQLFSPPSSSSLCLPSLPPAEELQFAGLGNFGDGGQLTPLDGMSYIPAPGQFSSPTLSLSIATSDQCDEEEVQQMKSSLLQHCLHLPLAPDGLSDTTIGGPAARSHADAVPPVVQRHGTSTTTTVDELQQLPLPTKGLEAQSGGGWSWLDLPLADEVQIQQMAPTINLPSQTPAPTLMINPAGPDTADHAASALIGSKEQIIRIKQSQLRLIRHRAEGQRTGHKVLLSGIPAAPQSRASTRHRANNSRALPIRQQDGYRKLLLMGTYMIAQIGWFIGKILKEEKDRSLDWQGFWRSQCKNCDTLNVICKYCKTVMRDPSTIELSRHQQSCVNDIHLLPASFGASKETQRSSQAPQIQEIVDNLNGESEPIETDNNNCAIPAQVDTLGTNAVLLSSQQQQHQLQMDREEIIATILGSQPCCRGPDHRRFLVATYVGIVEPPDSWRDLIIGLSDRSYWSSTTGSTHDGFGLKFSNDESNFKIVQVDSSPAWAHVLEHPYEDHPGVSLITHSDTSGNSHLSVAVGVKCYDWKSAPDLPGRPWRLMHIVLRALGLKKEFARDLGICAFTHVATRMRFSTLRSFSSSEDKGPSTEQAGGGDGSSGKRKRNSAPRRWSEAWNHFTEVLVEDEAGGSMVTKARCNHCKTLLIAESKNGTSHLIRHIKSCPAK